SPSLPPSSTSAASSSSAVSCQASAPAPTQSGTIPNCCEYYVIVSGDKCGDIEQEYGISSSDFRSWNPEINSLCYNLAIGYAYCVLVGPNITSSTMAAMSSSSSMSLIAFATSSTIAET
ncbi:carbohydrate-binding module family 50 protein, partial [Stipitochalara longipes BDJ]